MSACVHIIIFYTLLHMLNIPHSVFLCRFCLARGHAKKSDDFRLIPSLIVVMKLQIKVDEGLRRVYASCIQVVLISPW